MNVSAALFVWFKPVSLVLIFACLRGMSENASPAGVNAACVCKLCTRQLPAGSPGRVCGKQWCCRHCLSLESLLYRNLGAAEQQGWTTQGRSDFFKKSADTMSTGRYSWETIKTLVVEIQTEERVREQINKVRAKALPLAVWIAKGYEESAETTLKEIRRLVEQEIHQKEQAAKGKKSGKRKATDGDHEAEETEWDVVPHAENSGPAKGTAKAAKVAARTSKKEEKSLEKERAKQEKKNAEVSSVAARAAATLSRSLKSLTSLIQQAEKANHTGESLDAVKGALDRGTVWNEKAGNLLGVAAAIKGSGGKLPELTFTGAEFADYHKATTEVMKALRAELKTIKEEKEHKEKTAKEMEEATKAGK
eukprot:s2802_g8.t1